MPLTADDLDTIFADSNFRALPVHRKIADLSNLDENFKALPPNEQVNVIFNKLNPSAEPQPGKGFLETVADALGGAALSVVHPIEAFKSAAQAQELERQRAAEASQSGHPIEAFGHRLAAGMPVWLGPMAGQAGEDIGEGRTTQGLTEAGLALGPSAAAGAARALPPAGRFLRGAGKATPGALKSAAKNYGAYIAPLEFAGQMFPHEDPLVRGAVAAAGVLPAMPDIIRGGLAEMRGEQYPPAPPPTMAAPPVTFPSGPAPKPAPPVTFPPQGAAPTPKPAPPVNFPPVGESPAPPSSRLTTPPPVWPKGKPGRAPSAAAPTTSSAAPVPAASTPQPAAGGIPPVEVPFGQPVVTPPETLPSSDWRFEDARDMARLLNQHGINPSHMETSEWTIAAPALKRNLGVPNARAAQLVQQEWNKLQSRGQ